jgi:hypothetical protein
VRIAEEDDNGLNNNKDMQGMRGVEKLLERAAMAANLRCVSSAQIQITDDDVRPWPCTSRALSANIQSMYS